MKKTTYKDKSKDDLIKALNDKRVELRKLRFGITGSKMRDVKSLRSLRKDVARILTIINDKHE
jgi:ribosomal protein L29